MSTINVSDKEISIKIVYYGPGLSGKTTSLQSIHQMIPSAKRPKLVSLATEEDRTLFFDFLPVAVGRIDSYRIRVQLFTVPGQVHYDSTRKLVLKGCDGVVFVADSQPEASDRNRESLANLAQNLAEDGLNLRTVPYVIQFNKRDIPGAMSPEEMNSDLNPHQVPYFLTTAALGEGIQDALKGIVKLVLEHLKKTQLAAKRETESATSNWGATPATIQDAISHDRLAAESRPMSGGSMSAPIELPEPDAEDGAEDGVVPASGVHSDASLNAQTVSGISFADCWLDPTLAEHTAMFERLTISRSYNEAILAGEELLGLILERYGYAADQEAVFVLLCGVSGERYFRYQEIVAKAKRHEAITSLEALFVLHVLMQFALR